MFVLIKFFIKQLHKSNLYIEKSENQIRTLLVMLWKINRVNSTWFLDILKTMRFTEKKPDVVIKFLSILESNRKID